MRKGVPSLGSSGTLIFGGGATAGDNTHYTNLGGAILFNSSIAGTANFQNENSGTITFNNSHAGSGEIDNNEGTVNFHNGSNADSVKLISRPHEGQCRQFQWRQHRWQRGNRNRVP